MCCHGKTDLEEGCRPVRTDWKMEAVLMPFFEKTGLQAKVVCTPVIPEPERMRQEDGEVKASLGYIASLRPNSVPGREEGEDRPVSVAQWPT